MKLFRWLFKRWHYPVSLPEEIGEALGLNLPNTLTFNDLLKKVSQPEHEPLHLRRLMPRKEAERRFASARRKERFGQKSLFSYHFPEGWLELSLQFDEQDRLRRLYVLHQSLPADVEIPLKDGDTSAKVS